MVQKIFEKIKLKKLVINKSPRTYFIYQSNSVAPIEIEALNVFDAYKKSKIKEPVRIQPIRNILFENSVIDIDLKSEIDSNSIVKNEPDGMAIDKEPKKIKEQEPSVDKKT